jgi:hypothetical protein
MVLLAITAVLALNLWLVGRHFSRLFMVLRPATVGGAIQSADGPPCGSVGFRR